MERCCSWICYLARSLVWDGEWMCDCCMWSCAYSGVSECPGSVHRPGVGNLL